MLELLTAKICWKTVSGAKSNAGLKRCFCCGQQTQLPYTETGGLWHAGAAQFRRHRVWCQHFRLRLGCFSTARAARADGARG